MNVVHPPSPASLRLRASTARAPARRVCLTVTAQAKGGSKSVSVKKGFGAAKVTEVKKEPVLLDVDATEQLAFYKVWVRAGDDGTWRAFGETVVAQGDDIALALKERRTFMRGAASSIPEMALQLKGDMNQVQYGVQELDMSKAGASDEGEKAEVADDKPIVLVAMGGSIAVEVPAILRISGGGKAAGGSIWKRNESLYGGNDKVAAVMKKAIAKASGAASPEPAAEPVAALESS